MAVAELTGKIKGTPQPTSDGCVKGQKKYVDGPHILMECRVCGYGNGSWPGYFAIPDTPLNQKRADQRPTDQQNVPPVMCPACRMSVCGRMKNNVESLRNMEQDQLVRQALVQQQEIAELKRQLAMAKGDLPPAPAKTDEPAPETVKESLPRSGQRK